MIESVKPTESVLFVVKDRVSGQTLYPYAMPDEASCRHFWNMNVQPGSVIFKNHADFYLYKVGTVVDLEVTACPPEFVATFTDILQPLFNYIEKMEVKQCVSETVPMFEDVPPLDAE